ncbi:MULTISPECIES: hypothetical protein [unclassified Paraburkholderia]|uniref:hypothetical protein n=1 Tax=unclassified Paraburkholderia TaxID=2615204 RepID=UPI002AAFC8CE|nr:MULTISPECIES: hypothetical protein [unclassified Paraburkholderia]
MTAFGAMLVTARGRDAALVMLGAMASDAVPTTEVRGGVLLGTAIADLTAAPTLDDFNNLLAVLRAAGVIETPNSTVSEMSTDSSNTTSEEPNV